MCLIKGVYLINFVSLDLDNYSSVAILFKSLND